MQWNPRKTLAAAAVGIGLIAGQSLPAAAQSVAPMDPAVWGVIDCPACSQETNLGVWAIVDVPYVFSG